VDLSRALVALLGAAVLDPCRFLDRRIDELGQAAKVSEARLEEAQSRLESDLRRPLLRDPERSIPADARADLIVLRARAACALNSRLSGVSIQPANRKRLAQILDRPEFAGARTRNPEWLARWLRRLGEWFESLFEAQGAQSFASFTRALVLGLALAAAVAGWMRVVRWRRIARAPAPSDAVVNAPRFEEPAVHLSLAEAALSTDAREAIRQGLLALLSWLERHRLARPDRAKTNRELAKELPSRGANAELSDAVSQLLRWYDRAFYSLASVPRQEALEFVRRISALQSKNARETG
jgi:hypothetical protein